MEYSLTFDNAPRREEANFIADQLRVYNIRHAGDDNYRPFAIYARDETGRAAGGLLGCTYWGWLSVEILWVDEASRGQGLGSRLLMMAEDEAIRRGCRHAHLDTMDFQAPEFYEQHGYELWGVLDDIPEGHQRMFYRKDL